MRAAEYLVKGGLPSGEKERGKGIYGLTESKHDHVIISKACRGCIIPFTLSEEGVLGERGFTQWGKRGEGDRWAH